MKTVIGVRFFVALLNSSIYLLEYHRFLCHSRHSILTEVDGLSEKFLETLPKKKFFNEKNDGTNENFPIYY